MGEAYYTERQQGELARIVPDLFRTRELLFDLALKDLRIKYRYALIGFAWAVLEPLALMAVLTLIFGFVLADSTAVMSGGENQVFAVALLCGLVPWYFLANAVAPGTRSLVDYQNLVKKVYFPRELIPLSFVVTSLITFSIGFAELLLLHLLFGGSIGAGILWFPVIFLIEAALVTGMVLLFSCAYVFFRDIGPMVTVGITFAFYCTPVFYPLELVTNLESKHPWLVRLYLLNPMAELIAAYRQILFENRFPDPNLLIWPCAAAAIVCATGAIVFRKNSAFFADYL